MRQFLSLPTTGNSDLPGDHLIHDEELVRSISLRHRTTGRRGEPTMIGATGALACRVVQRVFA